MESDLPQNFPVLLCPVLNTQNFLTSSYKKIFIYFKISNKLRSRCTNFGSEDVSCISNESSWWWSRDSQLLEDRVRHVGDPARAGTSRELLKMVIKRALTCTTGRLPEELKRGEHSCTRRGTGQPPLLLPCLFARVVC